MFCVLAAEWAVSGRAVDVAHFKRVSSHPLKLTLSREDQHVQASNLAQAGHTVCAGAFNEHAWPRSGDGDADR